MTRICIDLYAQSITVWTNDIDSLEAIAKDDSMLREIVIPTIMIMLRIRQSEAPSDFSSPEAPRCQARESYAFLRISGARSPKRFRFQKEKLL